MARISHHATARDGTLIFWSSHGRGAPAAVLTDGLGCAGFIWRALGPSLAKDRRVIHWNYRGHGASGPPASPSRVTIRDCVDDLVAVLDDAREEKAFILAHSMGVQVALELHRRHPRRVAGLVLALGAPGRLLDTFRNSPAARLAFPFARDLVLRHPELTRLAFRALVSTELAVDYALQNEVLQERVRRSDLRRYFDDLSQVDPALFVRLLASAAEHDATDHLPQVDVPTLVVAGEADSFTPMRLSVRMHKAIPGSALLFLPKGTHVGLLEHEDLVARTVRSFLAAHSSVGIRTQPDEAAPRPVKKATASKKRR